MKVKTYKAMDMQEAIRHIKRDLGPQAVILSTRKVVDGRRAFGLFGRPMVEVTAALDNPCGAGNDGPPTPPGEGMADGPTARQWDLVRGELREMRTELLSLARAAQMPPDNLREEMGSGLEEIRWWVSYLARESGRKGRETGSGAGWEGFSRLVRQGMRESHALQIVQRIQTSRGHDPADAQDLTAALALALRRLTRVADPLSPPGSGPRVLALIGPTGVGKTTTVAKIAARCAMEQGRKVALVTNDTYRIAAVEQLRAYARIMGIPMEVVLQPQELPSVLDGLGDLDLILMDTAGRSPFDAVQMGELRALLDADPRVQSLLLVSASMDGRGLDRTLQRFGPLRPVGLIGTKLDEAWGLGALFSAALQCRLPFAFFTTGQRVPEDIRVASREDVAAWTLWGLPCFNQMDAMAAAV
jgi:flagellar biosynthesis protein FlhF